MKQSILIGLGGTGTRVVNLVAGKIKEGQLTNEESKVVCVTLDTNKSDNDIIKETGTGIPIIPTCDERTIEEYLSVHMNRDPMRWCPMSQSFLADSMIDGCSEIRVKSRIAFMDTMESEKHYDLERELEKVFAHRAGDQDKIRIMLVSSLAGGTGSGMFIQVALWLRKFFKNRAQIMIRGVFLLPDILLKTLDNAAQNPRKQLYYYANAYAAIRELNAIENAIRNPEEAKKLPPIIIDGLFDSHNTTDFVGVFDNMFFVDYVDESGANLKSIDAYEEMAAQLVYMQLYSPMQSELYSVEDNLYRVLKGKDPVYGSAGTSKAVFPEKDVREYCVLRAMQETLCNSNSGWGRIDEVINDKIREQKEAAKTGGLRAKKVNVAEEYVRLFDEWSKRNRDEGGSAEELYRALKRDVNNITVTEEDDKVIETFSCKIDDFMTDLENQLLNETEDDKAEIFKVISGMPSATADHYEDDDIEKLKVLKEKELKKVKEVLDRFDDNFNDTIELLIDRIAPFSFDRVSKRNRTTLYGLLMKHEDVQIEDEDLIHGVHPVAARYLVYKLTLRLEEELKGIVIPDRDGILSGAENKTTFDIERTRRVENLDEYFKQLGLITSTKEIAYFISQFKKYNEFDQMLCEDYEVQMLKRALYQRLLERTQKLCKTLEGLFATFVKSNAKNSGCLLQSLSTEISENIKRNASNATNSRIMYVYSDKNAKEELFETLDIDFAENNSELNQSIVDGAYGSMCATEKPSYACNKEFVNKTLEDVLYDCLYENYENRIDASTQISGTLSMSIVDAIRKECEATAKPGDDIGEKLKNALAEYKRKLTSYAAPFLKAKPNLDIRQEDYTGFEKDAYGRNWMRTASGQLLYMESRTSLTFWGINSDVVDENDHLLSEVLGINTLTAKDKKGYSRNELYCYRSIYAILAEDIPKFNELEDGDYYKFYSALVLKMLGREGAEYDTPHIDKTWHRVLPYISTTMRNKATGALYETIWKAIAYNTIVLDKGKYRIRSRMTDSFGKTHSVIEDLYENGRDIASGEIARLIRAVQSSDEFEFIEARELERTFEDDLRLHANKETDFMKNLAITGDLNPVSMMVRYMNSTEGTQEGFADMVGALTTLLDRVVKADTKRKTEEEAKTELLQLQYQIYSKCLRPAGKKKCFEDWVKEFEKNKIVKK